MKANEKEIIRKALSHYIDQFDGVDSDEDIQTARQALARLDKATGGLRG